MKLPIRLDDELRQHMRVPLRSFALLLGLLVVNVGLGAWQPFAWVWAVELGVAAAMVVVVLTLSMEVPHEPPLVRLVAVAGFVWVLILFLMTLTDYLSR